MFDQVVVALLLLAGITFVYVIGIRQSHPHDKVDKEDRFDGNALTGAQGVEFGQPGLRIGSRSQSGASETIPDIGSTQTR